MMRCRDHFDGEITCSKCNTPRRLYVREEPRERLKKKHGWVERGDEQCALKVEHSQRKQM